MSWLRERHLNNLRNVGMEIGNNCRIDGLAFLDRHGKLIIGNDVTITAWAKVLTHDGSAKLTGKKEEGFVIIKDGAFIGLNAIILDGVTIGKNSIVGAGAVVTKDVPDNEIWVGNPAIKLRSYVRISKENSL